MRQGIKIDFGGGSITLRPLNLAQIQEAEEDLKELRVGVRQEALKTESNRRLARVLAIAAKREDPDITPEKLLEMIDLEDVSNGTVTRAVQALMGMSGLAVRRSDSGDADPTSPQTGGDSTPDSPPAAAGAPPTSIN